MTRFYFLTIFTWYTFSLLYSFVMDFIFLLNNTKENVNRSTQLNIECNNQNKFDWIYKKLTISLQNKISLY